MKNKYDQLDCQEQGKIWDFTLFTNKQVNLPQCYEFWQKTHSSWARDKDCITHSSINDQKWSEVMWSRSVVSDSLRPRGL